MAFHDILTSTHSLFPCPPSVCFTLQVLWLYVFSHVKTRFQNYPHKFLPVLLLNASLFTLCLFYSAGSWLCLFLVLKLRFRNTHICSHQWSFFASLFTLCLFCSTGSVAPGHFQAEFPGAYRSLLHGQVLHFLRPGFYLQTVSGQQQ